MTKNIKCLVKESKRNLTGLVEVIREVPRLILRGGILFLPALILIASLVAFRPTTSSVSVLWSGFIMGGLIISILWMIIVGIPIDTVYFSPDGEPIGLVTRMKENAIDCGRGTILLIHILMGCAVILPILFLPLIIGTFHYLSTLPPGVLQTPVKELPGMDLLTLGLLSVITFIWAILIGIPVMNCYLIPVFERWGLIPVTESDDMVNGV